MNGDAQLLTGDPRGYSSFAGDFPALNQDDVEVLKNLKCNKS